MPVHVGVEIRRMEEDEFKTRVYEVMRHVFDVQRELGRLCHERIYQRAIASRVSDCQREVPIEIRHEGFVKTYYLDLLVGGGAVFEMKATESLAERHERQLMHYLFLTGLSHGKLINLRSEQVEHSFVNNVLSLADRTLFAVVDNDWQEMGCSRLKDRIVAMLHDWGTGLDLSLYEEVAMYFCDQPPDAGEDVEIHLGPHSLGVQRMRLAAPGIAIKVTALAPGKHTEYRTHLCRLLSHTDLSAVQWINVTRPLVEFRTIRKGK